MTVFLSDNLFSLFNQSRLFLLFFEQLETQEKEINKTIALA